MDQVHRLYVRHLNRTCELDVVRRLLQTDINDQLLAKLSIELAASREASAVVLRRKALKNWWNTESFVDDVNEIFVSLVERLPTSHEIACVRETGLDAMKMSLMQSSDFRYLSECRSHIPPQDTPVTVPDNALGVKYCCALGTSGIARVTRDIIRGLLATPGVYLELECVQFHNTTNVIDDDIRQAMRVRLDRYDRVITHGLPEFIPIVAKRERKKNPKVMVYAIVAWETDRLPFEWIPWLQHADMISCPSNFNSMAFRRLQSMLPPVTVVHHPVVVPTSSKKSISLCPIRRLKDKGLFVFYTVSEWSNRKGVTELIDAFAAAFRDDPDTWLYLKVSGDVPEAEGQAYLKRSNLTNVTLDYQRVSDEYIDCLHHCGDCFASMTKAEGHFVGVCQAQLAGNPVIVTGASGHLDYLQDNSSCHLIPVRDQSAKYCSNVASKHRSCAIMPHCVHFTRFVPCQMQWFQPDAKCAVDLMKLVRKTGGNGSKTLPENRFAKENVGRQMLTSILSMQPFETRSLSLAQSLSPEFLDSYEWTVCEASAAASLLVVNAGAYGNVGDHLYNHIFALEASRHGRRKLAITSITDNEAVVREPRDGKLVVPCGDAKWQNDELQSYDAIVFGGGGLLSRERLQRCSNLLNYAAWAQETGTPLYLMSVGFQDISIGENGDINGLDVVEGYKIVLEAAQHISVRSLMDYALCLRVLGFRNVGKVQYHPDIVYSLLDVDRSLRQSATTLRDTALIVFSEDCMRFLDLSMPKSKRLVFANFGGNAGSSQAVAKLRRIRQAVQEKYPTARFYEGLAADPNASSGASLFTVREMVEIMHRSLYVYTVRFHGYVLARICGVPTIVLGDSNNFKIRGDIHATAAVPLASIVEQARTGLSDAFSMIADGISLGSQSWTNHDRNSAIVRLSKSTGYSVGMIQQLNNRDIEMAEAQGSTPAFIVKS